MIDILFQASVLVAILGIAALILFRYGKRADDFRKARFSARDDISFDDFVGRYYKGEPLDHLRLRQALDEVARVIDVSPGRLRPTDRFDVELAPEKGWELDDGTAMLGRYLATRSAGEYEPISTLDEYLRARSS